MATCRECMHDNNCEWDHLYEGDDDAFECCDFCRPEEYRDSQEKKGE